jgi:hypothetical protein
MYGGLGGALQAAQAYVTANPGEKAAVILVTDGIPEGSYCSSFQLQIGNIANLAATGFGSTPSVVTFALGLQGSNEADLQTIAQAGGGSAFFLGSGSNTQQLLIDKLKSISGSLLACEYAMPQAQPGQPPVDPKKVNITFTTGSGAEQQFYKVDGPAQCVPGGWYYDNEQNPTKILLCPETCTLVQADQQGKIQIVLGCASIPPQ